jgi:hypothetical protein
MAIGLVVIRDRELFYGPRFSRDLYSLSHSFPPSQAAFDHLRIEDVRKERLIFAQEVFILRFGPATHSQEVFPEVVWYGGDYPLKAA